jgi:hypothetical protein
MNAHSLELAASAWCAAFLTLACAATPAPLTAKSFGSFRAIDPTDVTLFWNDVEVMDTDRDGVTTQAEVLSQLPNEGGHVTRARLDRWGKVVTLGESRSERGGEYDLNIDYGRYRTDAYEPHGESRLVLHSGIGTRIHLSFITSTGGVDLTSLEAIGAAADEDDVHGSIELQAIGISGAGISRLIPPSSAISSQSVRDVLAAAAAIKAQLHAPRPDVRLVAQVFGRRKPGPGLRVEPAQLTQPGAQQRHPVVLIPIEPELSSSR